MYDVLVASQVEAFHREGFLVVSEFLIRSNVDASLADCESFLSGPGLTAEGVDRRHVVRDVNGSGVKYVEAIDHYVPSIKQLMNLKLLTAAGQLLGQNANFWAVEMHDKVPCQGTITPPHQDNFYFCLDPPDSLTIYVLLEPHGKANGGLCYVRGSHKLGTLEHAKSKVRAFSSELLGLPPGEDSVFPIEMSPGDVVFHHCNTVHFAPQNHSDHHRRSVSIRVNGVRAAVSQTMRERYLLNKTYNREEQSA